MEHRDHMTNLRKEKLRNRYSAAPVTIGDTKAVERSKYNPMNFKCSLIISTYNWSEALNLCLLSVLNQKILPDEVIVADDGSSKDTRDLIIKHQKNFPVPLIHVWHEDKGHRKSIILNKAIATAAGDYIVQVDGDVIMHKHFVSDHLKFAEPDSFVRASRAYIDKPLSTKLIKKRSISFSVLSKGISNKFSAFRLPALWRLFEHRYKAHECYEIHGCNMAYWRNNAIAVNGYNENFRGWGPEDKEFIVRLLNKGYRKRFIKMGGFVFHLWHAENSRANLRNNESEFHKTIAVNREFCKIGVNQYLKEKQPEYVYEGAGYEDAETWNDGSFTPAPALL